jgi:hypothetical protein
MQSATDSTPLAADASLLAIACAVSSCTADSGYGFEGARASSRIEVKRVASASQVAAGVAPRLRSTLIMSRSPLAAPALEMVRDA